MMILKMTHNWPPHTILIASDSMFQNINERRLNKKTFTVKVRSFRGSTVNDMHTLNLLKFAQYYFSRTPRCANLSTARRFVRAKRSKIKNAKQQVHRDKRLGSSRNY